MQDLETKQITHKALGVTAFKIGHLKNRRGKCFVLSFYFLP